VGLRLLRKLREDEGFGLVELLIAMLILTIGLLALLSAFVSGATTLRRSSRIATASTLADRQMELYRALTYGAITLNSAAVSATDSTYSGDAALSGNLANDITTATFICSTTLTGGVTASTTPQTVTPASMTGISVGSSLAIDTGAAFEMVTATAATASTFTAVFAKAHAGGASVLLPQHCPSLAQPGPDHGLYRVDTYIVSTTPTSGRPVKLVTIAVRDTTNLSGRPLARISSAFDESTGL
jgi:prepilin-type N-terminal cleavage/methylation domain-containing protein